MMIISKVLEATVDYIKVLRWGAGDFNTPEPVFPYGFDSKPIKGKRAVVSDTTKKGKNVIFGYFLKSERTKSGESMIYATDDNGVEKFHILLKKDGTCELGGIADNMVRYLQLNSGIQQQAVDINVELTTIAAAIVALGGAYAPVQIVPDISGSKIDEIKTL